MTTRGTTLRRSFMWTMTSRQPWARPYLHEIKGIYWAEGRSGIWRRESRTWSLPSLVNGYSFRWIYALWNTLPISLRQPTRGRGSSTANKDRLDKHLEAKKEARAFIVPGDLRRAHHNPSGIAAAVPRGLQSADWLD